MAPCTTVTEKQNKLTQNKETMENNAIRWYPSILGTYRSPLRWIDIIGTLLLHIAFVVSIFVFDWLNHIPLLMFGYLFYTLNTFGVTAGAHRLWSHRSFKATLPLQIFIMLCFTSAGENNIYKWARDHRVHHKYAETDADPYNSERGFFFSHIGWTLMNRLPEVVRRGNEVDMSDIDADAVAQFHIKHFYKLKILLCFVIPIIIPPIMWGECWMDSVMVTIFRYVLSLHSIFLINSAAHMWGTKPYNKKIAPAQNLAVAILASGEGWHNYHHSFPWDCYASELGKYDVNFSALCIYIFAKLGLAYDLRTATPEMVRRAAEKNGDGSHKQWGATKWSEYEE